MCHMQRKNLKLEINKLVSKMENLSRFFIEDEKIFYKELVWKTKAVCCIDELNHFEVDEDENKIKLFRMDGKIMELSTNGFNTAYGFNMA